MDGVTLTKEKQIFHEKGDIFHIIKKSSQGFAGFEEAYFTTIKQGEKKGWKKHKKMTLNLVVPVGEVEFTIADGNGKFEKHTLSPKNYYRLTVEPNLWVSFFGIGEFNLVINIANLEHNPDEAENREDI